MPTTARGIWTPSDTDAVDFTTDLATMAGTIDNALDLYGNALRGTASQRAAFLSTAIDGMLWQDTDGIRMIWRKDGALWVPAVWRWRGTTAQMNSFGANAPDGFEWFSTTDNSEYVRLGGAWGPRVQSGSITLGVINANTLGPSQDVTFPQAFPVVPKQVMLNSTGFRIKPSWNFLTATGIRIYPANVWGTQSPAGESIDWVVEL